MRRLSRLTCAVLASCTVLAACSAGPAPAPGDATPRHPGTPAGSSWTVAHAGEDTVGLAGMQLAAEELSAGKGLLGRRVTIDRVGPDAPSLAASTDDPDVLGAVALDGAAAVAAVQGAAHALEASEFPVFVSANVYDAGDLTSPIFQVTAPHSWQAFRLARYFGPGDRNYSKVAILREPGPGSEVAARVLREAAELRSLKFVDVAAGIDEGILQLAGTKPDVVVLEGSGDFLQLASSRFADEGRRYQGRQKIHAGWRPQIAGFESLLNISKSSTLAPGTVAAGDYARPQAATNVEWPVSAFRKAFLRRFNREPVVAEAEAYDSVMNLAEALRQSGAPDSEVDHPRMLEELEKFDRVRFAHLPVSLAPSDHVVAERDVLGLWAVGNDGKWSHLMRTFTSDLERTNVLEDDWPVFFDGTTPGGEAPFYYSAKSGITTRKEDDLN